MASKYPEMRSELLDHLRDLADRRRMLVKPCKGSRLDEVVHFLFDDTPLGEAPNRAVGWFLHDEEEARLVGVVTSALDRVFKCHGTGESDPFYIDCEEWADVQIAATEAMNALSNST